MDDRETDLLAFGCEWRASIAGEEPLGAAMKLMTTAQNRARGALESGPEHPLDTPTGFSLRFLTKKARRWKALPSSTMGWHSM